MAFDAVIGAWPWGALSGEGPVKISICTHTEILTRPMPRGPSPQKNGWGDRQRVQQVSVYGGKAKGVFCRANKPQSVA